MTGCLNSNLRAAIVGEQFKTDRAQYNDNFSANIMSGNDFYGLFLKCELIVILNK